MWVLDTSALIRLFVPDGPVPEEAEVALSRAQSGADLLLAPQLILVEAANVLLRKLRRNELSGLEFDELLATVCSLPIRLLDHETLVAAAADIARQHDLTAYDAIFLAAADRHPARLITCDADLARVARSMGL